MEDPGCDVCDSPENARSDQHARFSRDIGCSLPAGRAVFACSRSDGSDDAGAGHRCRRPALDRRAWQRGQPGQVVWYAVGSGTIVTPDGLILTNQHLITPVGVDEKLAELETQLAGEGKSADLQVDAERFMVAISDGRHLPDPRYLARVVAEDPDLDLAVLRIDADERGTPLDPETLDLPNLPLGSSDAVNLGQTVHVFGFPAIGAGSLTYTVGIVSGFLFEEGIDGTAWIN